MLRLETSPASDAVPLGGVFPATSPRTHTVAVELQDRSGRVIGGVWLEGDTLDDDALELMYELLDARDSGPAHCHLSLTK